MLLKINNVEIAAYPNAFKVMVMDLDNAETTVRTIDGNLHRDRITVKRQIDLSWPAMLWDRMSAVLMATKDSFFEFNYPDPMTGMQVTKTFYVGNREAAVAIEKGGVYWWTGLQMTFTEK